MARTKAPQEDDGFAEAAQATEAPQIEHRKTVPTAPRFDRSHQFYGLVGQIRGLLQLTAYSRDPNAPATALAQIQQMQSGLPKNTDPELRVYLAEAADYLEGRSNGA